VDGLRVLLQLAAKNAPHWVVLQDTRPGGIPASQALGADLAAHGLEVRVDGRTIQFRNTESTLSSGYSTFTMPPVSS